MIEKSQLALCLATVMHSGQKDKAGVDYVQHPIAVAEMVESEEEKCVAYLHDVLEDTEFSVSRLRAAFGDVIADAVVAITHEKFESYEAYLERCAKNPIARRVKIADLSHNMDLSRLPNPGAEDIARAERYKKYRNMLQEYAD